MNGRYTITVNDNVVDQEGDRETWIKVKEVLDKNDKNLIIIYLIGAFVSLSIDLILMRMVLKYLEKLFTEIYNGDTPFTLENIKNIKKMAFSMIGIIIMNTIVGGLFNLLVDASLDIEIELTDFIEILFLFSMGYIFEYGYELQKDTTAKMYGDEKEEELENE